MQTHPLLDKCLDVTVLHHNRHQNFWNSAFNHSSIHGHVQSNLKIYVWAHSLNHYFRKQSAGGYTIIQIFIQVFRSTRSPEKGFC